MAQLVEQVHFQPTNQLVESENVSSKPMVATLGLPPLASNGHSQVHCFYQKNDIYKIQIAVVQP